MQTLNVVLLHRWLDECMILLSVMSVDNTMACNGHKVAAWLTVEVQDVSDWVHDEFWSTSFTIWSGGLT